MKKISITLWIALLLIPQMLIVRVLSKFPSGIEYYYSNGLYPLISKGFRYVFGWLPFSFGDVMYTVFIIMIIRQIILLFKRRFRPFKKTLIHLFAVLSVVYFAFHILWGMNYYRQPINVSLGIEKEYSQEDLILLTERLIEKSNALHKELEATDTLPVVFTDTKTVIFEKTLSGYKTLERQFPQLDYPPKSIKTSLLSYPLSVMGYSGYLNPISLEAQINGLIPKFHWPVVSCHEQAHQLGYAKENEANFMAVLATINNPDSYFQYSGSIFALRYCLNDVYRRDRELGQCLREKIHAGIFANYAESRAFWDSFENPLEPIFDIIYGSYLKANNQPDGIRTYSYMVALLVNYDKRFPGKL